MVQLSHPHMTTGKIIALTMRTFVGKVMSLFNMLSRFVITFLPRSRHLLISWLQSPSAMVLEPKKIKICYCFHFSPSICHKVMGPDAMILVFCMLSFKPGFSLTSHVVAFIIHLISKVVLFMLIASCFHSPVMVQPFLHLPFYTFDVTVCLFYVYFHVFLCHQLASFYFNLRTPFSISCKAGFVCLGRLLFLLHN